ncbi:hypothetical protein GGI25_004820 [Coemansia spiralis]|uniref:Uncharacterized protein n=2 Tax=Coemansia TaxID=4863 RepID=A0A9W8G3H2_9FUNG|nr:hypothetical protein EDC05_004799 [Coemansia umbellata]KAJ2620274.1 hypothetical protein GGI26_005163 [Coemansia sp. RSA 1358]KAJ2673226.1 hypothetical protein GGI25_004820 [Coemansia spiralis]
MDKSNSQPPALPLVNNTIKTTADSGYMAKSKSGSDKNKKNSSHNEDLALSQTGEHGILNQVASSASRLARSIAGSSAADSATAFDLGALTDAKSGQGGESSWSGSQEWLTENSHRYGQGLAEPFPLVGTNSSAATSFRQSARAASAVERSSRLSAIGNNKAYSNTQYGFPIAENTHYTERKKQSHQVKLAEDVDGRDVVEFLSHGTPTAMGTGSISAVSGTRLGEPTQRQHMPAVGLAETADPIAYLQSTTYAIDMEALDHQVPQGLREATVGTGAPSASPAGLAKAWDEHGASILEEWELNEAWDRAWMDTTWSSARKKEKATEDETVVDTVLPSNKNLSYLLKPRI